MPRGFTVSLVERKRSPFWQARIFLEGEAGRERWWSTGIRIGRTASERRESRRLAQRAGEEHAADLAAHVDETAPTPEDENALASVARRMLAAKKADGRRTRALETLAWYLDKHVRPYFGDARDVRTLRRADLEAFKAALHAAEYAPQTINNALNAIRAVLKHAHRIEERIEALPTVANVFRDPTPKGKALTAEEVGRLLASFDPRAEEARQFCQFIANTGMRKTEALSARWSWVDWTARLLRVPAEAVKRGKPRKPVALNASALAVLEERRAAHASRRDPEDDRIWREMKHHEALHSACDRAGMPRIRIHDLRHTRGSLLYASGASLPEVRDTLGHTTMAMVNHYAHTYPERLQEAADRVVLAPTTPTRSKKRIDGVNTKR